MVAGGCLGGCGAGSVVPTLLQGSQNVNWGSVPGRRFSLKKRHLGTPSLGLLFWVPGPTGSEIPNGYFYTTEKGKTRKTFTSSSYLYKSISWKEVVVMVITIAEK